MATTRPTSRASTRAKRPAHKSPGQLWAAQKNFGGTSNYRSLQTEITDLFHFSSSSPQAAIILSDDGEDAWGGAGDTPKWNREPFRAVVWIGPLSGLNHAVDRLLKNDRVGESLRRGAELKVDSRGLIDMEEQRGEAKWIVQMLTSPRPPEQSPESDLVIYEAIHAAAGQDTRGGGASLKVNAGDRQHSPPVTAVPDEKNASHSTDHGQADATGEVKRPTDLSAYIPATDILNKHDPEVIIVNYKALTKILKEHPEIKRHHPRSNRLLVHLRDWSDYVAKTNHIASAASANPAPEEIEKRRAAIRLKKGAEK